MQEVREKIALTAMLALVLIVLVLIGMVVVLRQSHAAPRHYLDASWAFEQYTGGMEP